MFWNALDRPNRRELIRSATATAGVVAISGTTKSAGKPTGPSFTHGVASGDPLQDKVILWTRVLNPNDLAKNVKGKWQVSSDELFSSITQNGSFTTGPARDYTVKVDATGLTPGETYYYRFIVDGINSPTGRTKTLPRQTNSIKLAVVSCANYSHGYFSVYKEIATRSFQAVLHLGDYIYEYAVGKYENPEAIKQGRVAKPKTEVVSLEDYRTRYALYRSDPDLLAAHAAHPFICVWDDHEVANDSWKDGAENHNEGQGDYKQRQKVAMQAYREWLPIRETNNVLQGKIYRSFELGQLGTLIMMDTRHVGRDRVLDYAKDLPMRTIPFDMSNPDNPIAILDMEFAKGTPEDSVKQITVPFKLTKGTATPMTDWAKIKTLDPKKLPAGYTYLPDTDKFQSSILGDDTRSIMGEEQENWLATELKESAAADKTWQILGQQLLAGKLGIPQLSDDELDYENSQYITPEVMSFFRMLGQMGLPLNLDAWDGYPSCRDRTYKSIATHANNAVFLAGDTHNAWAFNLKDRDNNSVAVELGTPSVSSPGLESYIPAKPDRVTKELMRASSELHFVNSKNRGWLELTITESELKADWRFLTTVLSKSYKVIKGPTFTIKAGEATLT